MQQKTTNRRDSTRIFWAARLHNLFGNLSLSNVRFQFYQEHRSGPCSIGVYSCQLVVQLYRSGLTAGHRPGKRYCFCRRITDSTYSRVPGKPICSRKAALLVAAAPSIHLSTLPRPAL